MSGKFVADLVVDGNSYTIRVHVVPTVCVFETGFDLEQRRFEFGGRDIVGVDERKSVDGCEISEEL